MGNKILVEFDRKELKKWCRKNCEFYKTCVPPSDEAFISCFLQFNINFEIKEQTNGKS